MSSVNHAVGRTWRDFASCFLLVLGLTVTGCGKSGVEQGLKSDANGFLCLACKSRFYTEGAVFANCCPECKKGDIEMVVGFQCSGDQHVTFAPRGKGFTRCEKCQKSASGLVIPSEKELKDWGAAKKSAADVGVNN
jgi:hypothetical protein